MDAQVKKITLCTACILNLGHGQNVQNKIRRHNIILSWSSFFEFPNKKLLYDNMDVILPGLHGLETPIDLPIIVIRSLPR